MMNFMIKIKIRTYILLGFHVTLNSSPFVGVDRFDIIRPRNVTSISGPRITDSDFSKRYCKRSIIPMSKKSKRRAAKKLKNFFLLNKEVEFKKFNHI